MQRSEVSICNVALVLIGARTIATLGENTKEAGLCSTAYPAARDSLLSMFPWGFAQRVVSLAEVSGVSDPLERYDYAYNLPSDYFAAGSLNVDRLEDYEIIGAHLFCSVSPAVLRYTARIEDPALFSEGFAQTLSARIAADICMPIVQNLQRSEIMQQRYLQALTLYAGADARQEKPAASPPSAYSWLTARGFTRGSSRGEA